MCKFTGYAGLFPFFTIKICKFTFSKIFHYCYIFPILALPLLECQHVATATLNITSSTRLARLLKLKEFN